MAFRALGELNASHLWMLAGVIFLLAIAADVVSYGDWFQRSGAVIVGISLIFFGYDFRKTDRYLETLRWELDDCIFQAEEPLREARSIAKIERATTGQVFAGMSKKNEQFLATRPAVEECRAEYYKKRDEVIALKKTEFKLVAVGTIVWGFGDVPFNLYECGRVLCQ